MYANEKKATKMSVLLQITQHNSNNGGIIILIVIFFAF